MNPPDAETFSRELLAFIRAELPSRLSRPPAGATADAAPLTVDTPLFATGLVDSLGILHLMAWVEKATGRTLRMEDVVMKNFGSVAAITAAFASPPTK